MAQDEKPKRISVVFPIILITVGVLFLLHNWRPAFDPLPILRTYWPLILVFIGLGKIWDNLQRSRNPDAPPGISMGATIGTLAFVMVIVLLLWQGHRFSGRHASLASTKHTAQSVDLKDAKSAHANLEMGAGQLTINSGATHFMDADFTFTNAYEEPRVNYNVTNGIGHVTVSQDSQSVHIGHSQNNWNLHFGKEIPLELKIDMGAGQGNLHLRDVPLTNLALNIGAGQVDVDLTGDRKADLTADIEGGVGQANIRLPKNVGVIAHASGGIGSIEVHGLKHDGDSYVNEAYGKSPTTIRLKVEGGIGEIVLSQEL
jgi:uncharacterized protein DUF2154/cell wall-active antibiotic response 4TMS protein YvqF